MEGQETAEPPQCRRGRLEHNCALPHVNAQIPAPAADIHAPPCAA